MTTTHYFPAFICPICQSPIIIHDKTWVCDATFAKNAKQHSFDVAKQGYINLLPVQFKKSKNPGDSEPSILARQRFLQQGYYDGLAKGLVEFTKSQLSVNDQMIWLDVGCGEGYYTEQILSLNPKHLIAMDISKPAVQTTAKRLKNAPTPTTCLVATASQMPLADNSVNLISSIFSPILPDEFARLLADNGTVLIAKPLSHHLIQLRQGLFETVQEHDSDKFIEQMAEKFELKSQREISADITVDREALADLMTMTPYAYRASPARRQVVLAQCEQTGKMSLSLAFILYWFVKK